MVDPAAPVTEDMLLGGRIRLLQPRDGYRAAIDPVLLAAAVPAEPQDTVLDLGMGVGAAALCLCVRVPGVRVTGLELQRELVRLAGENALLNEMTGRMSAMVGDLLRPPPRLAPGSFAHVMANPPFLEAGAATAPADPSRAVAHQEGAAGLGQWVRCALTMVRSRGTVTFIHRADRLDALLAELSGRAGELQIFPLWPGGMKPAKRVLVRARRDVRSPTRLLPGLVLHEADGRYTAAAEAVLRDAAALAF
jgi:tRNA1(Val) A37 N6-methylase TrmN6